MSSPEQKELERLFHLLAGLEPAEREKALERESVSPEMRRKVERMLSIDGGDSGTLLSTLPGTARQPDPAKGDRIDQYVLMERIGEGGMGEVFLARQEGPIRREVALKVIKRGMDTKNVVARFEAERQALALMDHSAVAKVLGAGSTPGGRPYFVMEHVRGVPITDHCDRNQMDTRSRLELFLQVCDGVQHAHQKAIIHRDLKPSNILVTLQGDTAVPKIIDFGVAKATAQRLTERTLHTEMGMLIGTPEYMSPEQAEMTGQGIDTRTDVYALGVILYELLTGTLPFESDELRKEGFASIQKVLREKEPPRPSTRVSTLSGDRSGEHARRRRVDVNTLRRLLSGDLDWITMKALEKDRMRRYGSPAELADDIRRHLRDEPVLAGPPSAAYRARKFVRRHRAGVAAAAAGLALLIAFAVSMAVQARRIAGERDRADAAAAAARKEAETARRVSDLMVELFGRSDPGRALGHDVTVREVLDAGAEKVIRELNDEPEVQARLLATIGDSFRGLGRWDRATEILRLALEKTIAVHGDRSLEAARTKLVLSYPLVHLADFENAEKLNREALATMRELLPPGDPEISDPINHLSFVYLRAQKPLDEIESLLREALEIQRQAYTGPHDQTATSMDELAWVLLRQNRNEEAVEMNRQALKMLRALHGEHHPRAGYILQRLGLLLGRLGRYDEGLAAMEGSLRVAENVYPGDHPEFWLTNRAISELLIKKGDHAAAIERSGEAVEHLRRFLEPGDPELAQTLLVHGQALSRAGRLQEAERTLTEAEGIYRGNIGGENSMVATILGERGDLARRQGRLEEAESLLREALALWSRVAPDRRERHVDRIRLAQALMGQGRVEEACRESGAALAEAVDLGDENKQAAEDARALRTRCGPAAGSGASGK